VAAGGLGTMPGPWALIRAHLVLMAFVLQLRLSESGQVVALFSIAAQLFSLRLPPTRPNNPRGYGGDLGYLETSRRGRYADEKRRL
jgi:hypothetical protein